MENSSLHYSNKSFLQRLVLFLAGFSNFFVGFAIYYIIKDNKEKEFEAEFIQRGAMFSLVITIILLIACLIAFLIPLFLA